MRKFLVFILLGLAGCTWNVDMQEIRYDYLLHDGNSKVWMIEQMIVGDTDITATHDSQKELIIFFQNGNFQYIPLQELGRKNGRNGGFFLDSDERTLKFYFKEEEWYFNLTNITEESIYLEARSTSDAQFSMELVPLKEIVL